MNKYFETRFKSQEIQPSALKEVASYPKNALIELTNGCNHACVFCKNSNQERRSSFLNIDLFKKFITDAVGLGLKEVGLYSTGEPFMLKNLNDFISIAKSSGVERVYITTNGALATLSRVEECYRAGLDSIKFSINAENQNNYKLVHGKDDFEAVLKNVRDIYEWKKATAAKLQMIASCVTIPALRGMEKVHNDVFRDFFEDILYVDSGSQGGQAYELGLESQSDASGVFHNFGIEYKSSEIKPCSMLWNRYHLTSEGYLSACCVDYEHDLTFANLNHDDLESSWNNQAIKDLRLSHINGDLKGLLCDQCMHNRPAPYKPIKVYPRVDKTKDQIMIDGDKLRRRIKILNSSKR